ncbi:MAG: hypothetical protein LBU51_07710, partial [Bacteroidales bacterium]|nr:hypothetical protein [Bacteroidales bacterium]
LSDENREYLIKHWQTVEKGTFNLYPSLRYIPNLSETWMLVPSEILCVDLSLPLFPWCKGRELLTINQRL